VVTKCDVSCFLLTRAKTNYGRPQTHLHTYHNHAHTHNHFYTHLVHMKEAVSGWNLKANKSLISCGNMCKKRPGKLS